MSQPYQAMQCHSPTKRLSQPLPKSSEKEDSNGIVVGNWNIAPLSGPPIQAFLVWGWKSEFVKK